MNFDSYKQQFDRSFSKVSPNDFVKEMESLGYKFGNVESNTPVHFHGEISVCIPTIEKQKYFVGLIDRIRSCFHSNVKSTQWYSTNAMIHTYNSRNFIGDLKKEFESIDLLSFTFEKYASACIDIEAKLIIDKISVKTNSSQEHKFDEHLDSAA